PIKRCRMADEACLLAQSERFFHAFAQGVPQWGVPPLEPLRMGTLHISSGQNSGTLQFSLSMMNTTMHHFADSVQLKSIKGFAKQLDKPMKLFWTIASPALEVRAKYDVNGKILILPIVSKGDVVINLYDVHAKSRVIVEPETRTDGKTYLKIVDFKTIGKVGSGHFNMSNLFNDNVELRESTMKVLNSEWGALSADIQPSIMEAADRVFRQTLQKFWDAVPYEEFFEQE
ncbi:hypothetical protein KR222_007226, partial [Zaprionus bogoriensis]